jgi:glucose-1-phosphate adenylyltransferase
VAGTVERSVLSPGVIVHPLATVRNSVILNDVEIMPGAVVDNCIIDKHTKIGAYAKVGFGDDLTPNIEHPELLTTGITVLGKHLNVPEKMVVGRNVRIFQGAELDKVSLNKINSGETIR